MLSTTMINTPCIIIRRGPATDAFYEERDEELVDTVCELQQRQRSEPGDEGDLSKTIWDVFFLIDTPTFDSGDGLLIGDDEYEFEGKPWKASSSSGCVDHIEATAIQTVGAGDMS